MPWSPASRSAFLNDSSVYFCRFPGKLIPFDPSCIEQDGTWSESVPLSFCKDGNTFSILLNNVPAIPFRHNEYPLVKVREEKKEKTGFRSGGRSALLYSQDTDKIYRLKGCGNYVNQDGLRYSFPGFPIQDRIVFGEVIGSEIRGCCFVESAIRELMMSHILQRKLAHFQPELDNTLQPMCIGNQPIGYWQYEISEELVPSEVPIICSLFETFGEKRLATHLLAGLDILLEHGIILFDEKRMKEKLQNRRAQGGSKMDVAYPLVTYIACCSGEIPAIPFDSMGEEFQFGREYQESIQGTLSAEKVETWKELVASLEESLDSDRNAFSFVYLYWRLGREVGEFLRFLKEKEVMWGYFFDHNPVEPHCNSHPNNFILLPPGEDEEGVARRFLAPVDFDMCFTKETFCSPYSKQFDASLFDSWKQSEYSEMMRALGGDIANDGLLAEAKENSENVARYAMLDTLLSGFLSSYHNENDIHTEMKKSVPDRLLETFIAMALLLTSNKQS